MHNEADSINREGDARVFQSERGAVGTEMAIVVAIVVAIALALGAVMFNSADSHQDCIPATPGADVPEECESIVGD